MMIFLSTTCLLAVLSTVNGGWKDVDPTDLPPESDYQKYTGHRIIKYALGSSSFISPRECAELCDNTPRCVGFNIWKKLNRCWMTTQNAITVTLPSRFGEHEDYDHYAKLDTGLNCPEGSFPHPYKSRCYQVVTDQPVNWLESSFVCRRAGGQVAVIPNQLTLDAIWGEIEERLGNYSDLWIALEMVKPNFDWVRNGAKSPLLWKQGWARGGPPVGLWCGTMSAKYNGKFHYAKCDQLKPFLCEYRTSKDTEINEVCPQYAVLYDDNCYWTEDNVNLRISQAIDKCVDRGGSLVDFPTDEAIEFVGRAWGSIFSPNTNGAWIGVEYQNSMWLWSNGEQDSSYRFWGEGEREEGPIESCAAASQSENTLLFTSEDCFQQRPFLCMGESGKVMSRECSATRCPKYSTCHEGPYESHCECDPGFQEVWDAGKLYCRIIHKCAARGDPHYWPFDGGLVHYQGLCTHVFASVCPGTKGVEMFRVLSHNSDRGLNLGVTWIDYAIVFVYGHEIKIGMNGLVIVDGASRSGEVLFTFDGDGYLRISVVPPNDAITIRTDFGLRVTYFTYILEVDVTQEYENKMCGLCGDLNGEQNEVNDHDQAKWMIGEDANKPECQNLTPYSDPECPLPLRLAAEERCGQIRDSKHLEKCKEIGLEVNGFYTGCVTDICATGEKFLDMIACNTMDSLVNGCKSVGAPVDPIIRVESNCPMNCIEHSTYNSEMSLDVATCQNPDGHYDISRGTGEGCECDIGYIQDSGKCVPKDKCGCSYNEKYMTNGESMVSEDCTEVAHCGNGGEITITGLNCHKNAECTSNENTGMKNCECSVGYIGDGIKECKEKPDCPYPMPGDPGFVWPPPANPVEMEKSQQSHTLNLHNFAVNSYQLSLNEGDLDQNIVLMKPGSTIVNNLCQTITCFHDEKWEVSETACVPNAKCVASGETFVCNCKTGYVGDGTKLCEEDTTGNGDPHFLITSHTTGDHLCFDAHGYKEEIWSLINDPNIGLKVNGELFETEDSTKERPQSYFSKLSLNTLDYSIIFSRTGILYNQSVLFDWDSTFESVDMLQQMKYDTISVTVQSNIVLKFTRSYAEKIGYYLGVMLTNSEGLSGSSTGIIGQFVGVSFAVEATSSTKGVIHFSDAHLSIPVTAVSRYYRSHQGSIPCWHYNALYDHDYLLGSKSKYSTIDLLK